jgi:hypothetical protein
MIMIGVAPYWQVAAIPLPIIGTHGSSLAAFAGPN